MTTHRPFFIRSLAALALAISLGGITTAALSQGSPVRDPSAVENGARAQQRREHLQARLNDAAKRLQIDARQQDAWNDFSNTVLSLVEVKPPRPMTDADADAATLIRLRAMHVEAHAQKLTELAQATERLQGQLTSEQRKTLTQIVREYGRMPHERMQRHHGSQPRTP